MNNEIKHDNSTKAISIAFRYGQIDSAHHRLWVIDQMVRALLGCEFSEENNFCVSESEKYKNFVKMYESEDCEPGDYKWDVGIPP